MKNNIENEEKEDWLALIAIGVSITLVFGLFIIVTDKIISHQQSGPVLATYPCNNMRSSAACEYAVRSSWIHNISKSQWESAASKAGSEMFK